jgi:hypothetical protein
MVKWATLLVLATGVGFRHRPRRVYQWQLLAANKGKSDGAAAQQPSTVQLTKRVSPPRLAMGAEGTGRLLGHTRMEVFPP